MIENYIKQPTAFPLEGKEPWEIVRSLNNILYRLMEQLDDSYTVKDGIAIHKTAVIGHNVTIKAPAVISAHCFVGSNSYLRNGVFLAPAAKVGISCEVKTTVMMENSVTIPIPPTHAVEMRQN